MSLGVFRVVLAFLASCILFSTASAGRLSDFARRRGFGPHVERSKHAQKDAAWGTPPKNTSYRFLSPQTEPFQVKSLPDIPFDLGETYSGLIPIDAKDRSRELFFVFQPTIGAPTDEIVIWLNGGPGCSSLEGFLQENGRFVWGYGQYEPTVNPYSWVNLTNVLWVEHPVGTGFSIGEVRAATEEEIAIDFVNFFENFQKTFGIKKFKIYVTGESYAGRYVPYISAALLDKDDPEYFNLSGALVYDPCIGSCDYIQGQVPTLPFVQQNNNLFGLNKTFLAQVEELDESCGYASYREEYLAYPPSKIQPPPSFNYSDPADLACDIFDIVANAAYAVNPCWNVYDITATCPFLSDPLGFPTGLEYSYPGLPVYFDRPDVKEAMHAPHNISWSGCGGPVFKGDGDISLDSIQAVLPRVIEATNRVLVTNGDLDMIVLTNGTLLSIQNMTWNGDLGFQEQPSTPIVITLPDLQYQATFAENGFAGGDGPQGTMGIQHFERGLLFAQTYLSGHMQPQFQPRSSYRHLQWLLGHIEAL